MKVLLYNFAPPDEETSLAGGVGVYLRTLARSLAERGCEVVVLSSGRAYSPWTGKVQIRHSKGATYAKSKIINSPVIAPSHLNFFSQDTYLRSPLLDAIPSRIAKRYGAIDVFHFHNIEGLTLGFFQALRATFPTSRILFTAHNYNLVCPQVNLWKNERVNCTDYKDGNACISCIVFRDSEHIKRVNAGGWLEAKVRFLPRFLQTKVLAAKGLTMTHRWAHYVFKDAQPILRTASLAQDFRDYRDLNIAACQTFFDSIIAVSNRTAEVLVNHGVDPRNVVVSYIGSAHVKQAPPPRRESFGGLLHIAFIGYTRRDKGFFFLLRALEAMDAELAGRIAVTFAARTGDERIITRVGRLAEKIASVNLINGYKPADLQSLLKDVSLGIVPPLWEDNLPQVAIEFVANGIPVLTSDTGGASEIAGNPDFVFKAGSIPSFLGALRRIASGDLPLREFWKTEPNIRAPETHIAELLSIYQARPRVEVGEEIGRRTMPQGDAVRSLP